MIAKSRAIEILAAHATGPNEPSETLAGRPMPDSTFFAQVGDKPEYKLMEVLGWLGYCCRFC